MAFSKYVSSFAKTAGIAAQPVTGVGFQPKLVIFWGSDQTATGFTDAANPHVACGSFFWGWDDGTHHVCSGVVYQDASAGPQPNIVSMTSDLSSIVRAQAAAFNVSQSEGKIATMDADGFTITWTYQDGFSTGAGYIVNYMALGGSSLSWHFGEFDRAGAVGSVAYTGTGFKPTALLYTCLVAAGATTYGTNQEGRPMMGWATTPVGGNGALTECAPYPEYPMQAAHAQSTTRCIYKFEPSSVSTIGDSASLSSMDADGFHLCWAAKGTGIARYAYLAIGGIGAQAGTINQAFGTGIQTTTGVVGSTPEALFLMSAGSAASSGANPNVAISFGGTDGTRQASSWVGVTDGSAPTVAARYHSTTDLLTLATPAATGSASVVDGRVVISSFGANQFALNWSITDTVARQILYLALGGAVVVPASDTCPPAAPVPPAPPVITTGNPPPETPSLTSGGGKWRLHRFDIKPRAEDTA